MDAILSPPQCVNPSADETEILQYNYHYNDAHALSPCYSKTSPAISLCGINAVIDIHVLTLGVRKIKYRVYV